MYITLRNIDFILFRGVFGEVLAGELYDKIYVCIGYFGI